jgi:glycosyltransferase involved in cell wall biosynthesis
LPKISIIVPIYNIERHVEQCIASIISQTITDLEIILVNDGSTDNSGEICDQFASIDKRIRVIHKKNGGLSDARNKGIESAKGDFIGFVDGDDFIEPKMYETLYNLNIKHSADISTCKISTIRNNKTSKEKKYTNKTTIFNSYEAIKFMYGGKLTGYSACNKLYSSKLFEEIKFPNNRIFEDAAIMYKLYDNANKIVQIDWPFYNYVYREQSITHSKFSEKRFDIVKNYCETTEFMKQKYPNMCEMLDVMYYSSLRNMLVDIVNEKNIIRNYPYIKKISQLIKEFRHEILKNKQISRNKKALAHLITWNPLLIVILYRLRIKLAKGAL